MSTLNQKDLSDSNKEGTAEHLVALLLDFYRNIEHQDNWQKAAKIALNWVTRLSLKNTLKLEKRFLFLAKTLHRELSVPNIRKFAQECVEAALQLGFFSKPKPPNLSGDPTKSLQRKALSNISAAMANGFSPTEAINFASKELMLTKKKLDQAQKLTAMVNAHPLRDNLHSLKNATQKIAPEDIRNQLLRLKSRSHNQKNPLEGKLLGILQKTASFSSKNLHRLLGDELYFYCRPLGFSDNTGTLLVIEVPSSAHLYALTYRKLEILNALRIDPTFKDVKNIRFKVRSPIV